MASYEALYGRLRRSVLCWMEDGEGSLVGAELAQTTSVSVAAIKRRLIQTTDERILTTRWNIQVAQS